MISRATEIAVAVVIEVGMGAVAMLRFVLYVLLLIVGRALEPIVNVMVSVGLIVFIFCLIFRRDQVTPMCAGAALALSATAVSVAYTNLLRMVAPPGTVIISDL